MVLVKLPLHSPLDGHRLVVITQYTLSHESLSAIRKQFPKLNISVYNVPWGSPNPGENVPDEVWKDTAVLLTDRWVPDPKLVPKLQLVQITSAGANSVIETPLFLETDTPFCTANGVHGPQIAEWIVSTFLVFQHQLLKYVEIQKQKKWERVDGTAEDAVQKTIGILGYGSIGRQTARIATALGMKVHAYTLHPRPTPESRYDDSYVPAGLGDAEGKLPTKWFSGGEIKDIHDFLSSGLDQLVISLPLTSKTHHLIARPEFEILSDKKTFVTNISRGPIVNTEDLIEALESEKIRGAALDVTDPEPLPDGHPLFSAKNVLITPHVSYQSLSNATRVLDLLQLNLGRLSQGRRLVNQVSRKDGY